MLFEFLQWFLSRTENGAHGRQHTVQQESNKIATTTLRRPDVRFLLGDFHHFSFAPLHFVENIFSLYLHIKSHRHALTVHRDENTKKERGRDIPYTELLYFAKCFNDLTYDPHFYLTNTLCLCARRWRRLMNWLMKIRSIAQIKLLITIEWWNEKKMMQNIENERANNIAPQYCY